MSKSSLLWYREHREHSLDRMTNRRIERTGWLAAIKLEAGCLDCGYRDHACALDFDHVRGEKAFTISNVTARKWETILAEIEKCEVVCANCHRVRTRDRRPK